MVAFTSLGQKYRLECPGSDIYTAICHLTPYSIKKYSLLRDIKKYGGYSYISHLLADDFRVEERFRFKGHLFSRSLCRDGKKPSVLAVRKKRH